MTILSKWSFALLCGFGFLLMSESSNAQCGLSVQGIVYNQALCGQNDGSAQLYVQGGVPPLSFVWSGGVSTTAFAGNLAAGIYTVTVSDAGSCVLITQVEIENVGSAQILSPATNAATCALSNGGFSFDLQGTAPFTVSWTGAAVGSQGGLPAGVSAINGLPAGAYAVTVSDANGCLSFIDITVPRVGGITMNVSALQQPACAGGANGIIRAQATSGSLPFEFFLDGVSQGVFFSNIHDFSGLTAGAYSIVVRDNNGCEVAQTFILNEVGSTPLSAANFNFVGVSCPSGSNGSATALAPCPTCEVYNAATGVLMGTLAAPVTGLAAGQYEVVLSTGGCVSLLPFTVNTPADWLVGNAIANPSCTAGDADIDLTVGGATAGYTYQWSNGATSQDLNNLLPGAYVVTVSDAAGCSFVPNTFIVRPCRTVEVVTVFTNTSITFCVDTNDVAGNVSSVFNLCPGLVNNGFVGPIGLDGCINYTASFQMGFDTLCIEVCGDSGFDCDTTTVVFMILSPIDTLFVDMETGQTQTFCPPLTALPGAPVSAVNLNCTATNNGTVTSIDPTTACMTFGSNTVMGLDTVCIQYCDAQGFCDTAVFVIRVYSPIDTTVVTLYTGSTVTVCPNNSQFPAGTASALTLNCAPVGNGTLVGVDPVTGCITYTADNTAGNDQICIQVCDNQGNCDTTVFLLQSVPRPDTVVIDIVAGSPVVDTCAYNLQFPGTLVGVTNLNCDNQTVGGISVDALTGCVSYTPATPIPGSGVRADTVCLVYCDNSVPVAYCDTVIFIFNNMEPVCAPVIPASIVFEADNCANATYCLPIPLDSISFYNLTIDGQPYTGTIAGCDIIRRIQYPLALIPPCSGDFTLSWVVNGVTFGPVTVTGVAGIITQLNLWDANTAWSFASNPNRIVGVTDNDNLVYGNLIVGCVGSTAQPISIGPSLQDQYAQGTRISFGAAGSYTLAVTNNVLNCLDVAAVDIYCVQSEIVNDTVQMGQTTTYCGIDLSQVPNVGSITNACPSASTGNVTFVIDSVGICLVYTGVFPGDDLACIVICDSSGTICDTTYFFIHVPVTLPIAFDDTVNVVLPDNAAGTIVTNFNICNNDFFSPSDYSITIISQPQGGTLTVNASDSCEWSYVYDADATDFCGTTSFQYVLSNSYGTDTATVYIDVSNCLFVSQFISPNGDGINDFFVVKNLVDYPDHEIFVFNRWGNRVLYAQNYQNDWNGTFGGRDLPDGTYFYLIYFNDARNRVETGPLIIQR